MILISVKSSGEPHWCTERLKSWDSNIKTEKNHKQIVKYVHSVVERLHRVFELNCWRVPDNLHRGSTQRVCFLLNCFFKAHGSKFWGSKTWCDVKTRDVVVEWMYFKQNTRRGKYRYCFSLRCQQMEIALVTKNIHHLNTIQCTNKHRNISTSSSTRTLGNSCLTQKCQRSVIRYFANYPSDLRTIEVREAEAVEARQGQKNSI